jgi:hypothetical protein
VTKNEKQAHVLNIMDELIRLELKGASSNDAAKQAFDNWQARVNCNESENNTIKKYIFNHRASAEKLYFRKRLKPSNRSTLTNQYKALFLGLIRSGVSNASAIEMSARKIKDDTSLSVEEARYCLFLIEELNTKKRSVPKNNKESYADNKIFNCSKCDRKFMNEQALNFHKSDEHAENHNSYSNNHSRKNLQDVVVENKAIAAEPNPRLSVPSEDHGESNRPFRAYFNANAYSQALMKMTQPEAWKLAINEEESNIFLSVTLEAYAHSSVTSTSIKENEKDPAVIKENHLNHEDVKATSRTVEVNTTVRHAGDQADFKARVKSNFNGRCAVTGYYRPRRYSRSCTY